MGHSRPQSVLTPKKISKIKNIALFQPGLRKPSSENMDSSPILTKDMEFTKTPQGLLLKVPVATIRYPLLTKV